MAPRGGVDCWHQSEVLEKGATIAFPEFIKHESRFCMGAWAWGPMLLWVSSFVESDTHSGILMRIPHFVVSVGYACFDGILIYIFVTVQVYLLYKN